MPNPSVNSHRLSSATFNRPSPAWVQKQHRDLRVLNNLAKQANMGARSVHYQAANSLAKPITTKNTAHQQRLQKLHTAYQLHSQSHKQIQQLKLVFGLKTQHLQRGQALQRLSRKKGLTARQKQIVKNAILKNQKEIKQLTQTQKKLQSNINVLSKRKV